MWGIPAAIFFIAFIHRVVPGIVAKDVMQAFGATGAIVGLLSSMYFYSYAGFMIPAGLLIDGFGARSMIAAGAAVMGAGSLAMGVATAEPLLFAGRFVERAHFITSPGFGDGAGWRERVGLPRGGPAAVITTLGVFRFDPDTREMYLASYHPEQSVDSVKAATGWDLRVATDVRATPTPTGEELAVVRACDPAGFWTR